MNGGALVRLERLSAGRGCCPGVALPGGTGRSPRLRDQYPIGPGRSPRLRDPSPRHTEDVARPGRSLPLGQGPVIARLSLHATRAVGTALRVFVLAALCALALPGEIATVFEAQTRTCFVVHT